MASFKLLAALLLSLGCTVTAQAQDFLAYFHGNRDSLVAAATRMIQAPEPGFSSSTATAKPAPAAGQPTTYRYHPRTFTMRDGRRLHAYRYGRPAPTTVLLLHGVATDAASLNQAAGLLREATGAMVCAVDLRGHGRSEGRPGDVDYLDQYADDVADVVATLRRENPRGRLILAGHSMGGGVALRYCQRPGSRLEGLLLLAPLLGHDSPAMGTARPTGASGSAQSADFMHIHLARIIGLKILNSVAQHQYDSLPVLFLNVPVSAPLRQYSYRANASMAPEHYAEGLRAVHVPLLVVVGDQDEVFGADAQCQAVRANSQGQVEVVTGATHDGLCQHARTYQLVGRWVAQL